MAEQVVKKHFVFSVTIGDVKFNNIGSFFLKLSINSSFTSDYTGLWIKTSSLPEDFRPGHSIKTDVVHHLEKKDVQFQQNKLTFFLPKGFCSNDANHDVYLLVEAFQVDESARGERRVGECKYAIFPRTNKPRANLYANPGENMYRHTDTWTLLRTLSSGNLQMHCGRMRCVTTFSEITDPPEDKTPRYLKGTKSPGIPKSRPLVLRTPVSRGGDDDDADALQPHSRSNSPGRKSNSPDRKSPALSPKSPDARLLHLRSPSPEFEFEDRKSVLESPRSVESRTGRPTGEHAPDSPRQESHVAGPDTEDIVLILHGAANLPSKRDGGIPQPYCILKMLADDETPSDSVSNTPPQPTHSPSYQQRFIIKYAAGRNKQEVLMVQFADKETKEVLITYNLPASLLSPFHQYHMEMIMPARHSPSGVRVFASLMRRTATLPQDLSSPNFLAFEVYLQGVEQRLKNPLGQLIAVARIVPDYYSYNWANARETDQWMGNLVRHGGVAVTTVTFPSPHPSAFALADSNKQGSPQITLPGSPPIQPEWNHSFLFSQRRDKATLFTPSAALVIEYFQASNTISDMSWRLRSPVGFSTLLLDQDVYKQLTRSPAKSGVNVRKLPVQGTSLRTFHDKPPTVGLIIRIVTSERPTALAVPSDPDTLPYLQYIPQEERDPSNAFPSSTSLKSVAAKSEKPWNKSDLNLRSPSDHEDEAEDDAGQPGYWLKQRIIKKGMPVKDDNGLLPYDAMESVLPEYNYIFVDPHAKGHHPAQRPAYSSRLPADLERTSLQLVEHQMSELEKYRSAVRKMGEDILALRQQIRELETSNSHLRRDLARYNDSTKLLLDSQELDALTKPELAVRYVAVKQKLSSQTVELRDRKDQVQKLHNQLIKQKNQEKELLKISDAHKTQNKLVQKLQSQNDKVLKLEDACKKQEKVIGKMERLLANKGPKDVSGSTEALGDENKRLRGQLDDIREQNRLMTLAKGINDEENEERLQLYETVEKTESRVASLEQQLAENARRWGHEKADLLNKIQEAEPGLRRTSPVRKPNKATGYSYDSSMRNNPRKYSKASMKHQQLVHSTRDPYDY